jgi:hypothetical protein
LLQPIRWGGSKFADLRSTADMAGSEIFPMHGTSPTERRYFVSLKGYHRPLIYDQNFRLYTIKANLEAVRQIPSPVQLSLISENKG